LATPQAYSFTDARAVVGTHEARLVDFSQSGRAVHSRFLKDVELEHEV
jgi:hypothetical protein